MTARRPGGRITQRVWCAVAAALFGAACASPEPEPAPQSCTALCGAGTLAPVQAVRQGDDGLLALPAVLDLAVDPATGTAWVLTGETIVPIRRDGPTASIDTEQIIALSSPATALVWTGGRLWASDASGVGPVGGGSASPVPGRVHALGLRDGKVWGATGGVVFHETDGAESTGLAEITDLSTDAALAVSRPEGALAYRAPHTKLWGRVDASTPGFEALAHAEAVDRESALIVVGARGLHRLRWRDGEAPEPLGEVALPAPHGIERGWADESPATVHDVAVREGAVYATTLFGGYLMRWDRSGTELLSPVVLPVQPLVSNDDYDEDSFGIGMGVDPTKSTRQARLVVDGEGVWLMSSLWRSVLHSDGGAVQQGQGGVLSLAGAYTAVVSPDGRHVYTGAWNVPDPAGWTVTPEGLEPSASPDAPVRPLDYGTPDVAVAPDGAQLYAIDDEFNRVHVYDRDEASGALTWRNSVGDELPLELLVGVSVASDGRFVYACDFDADTLVAFPRGADGGLGSAEVFVDGVAGVDGLYGAEDAVPSPDGRHVYVVSYRDAAVARFTVAATALTFDAAYRPADRPELLHGIEAGAFTPDGGRLVVVSPVTDRVIVLSRAPSGELSVAFDALITDLLPGPPLSDRPANPGRIAIGPRGDTAVVTLRMWDAVAVLRLSPGGSLTASHLWDGGPAARWPNGVALSPDGASAFVTSALGDSLHVFRVLDRAPGVVDGCGGSCP